MRINKKDGTEKVKPSFSCIADQIRTGRSCLLHVLLFEILVASIQY